MGTAQHINAPVPGEFSPSSAAQAQRDYRTGSRAAQRVAVATGAAEPAASGTVHRDARAFAPSQR